MIRLPRGANAHRTKQRISNIDIPPTILKTAGLTPPEAMVGHAHDLHKEITNKSRVFVETIRWINLQTVFDGDYKLVWNLNAEKAELYDMSADPKARVDIADEKPEVVERLQKLRLEWRSRLKKRRPGAEKPKVEKPKLDDELQAQLKALGYIDPGDENKPTANIDDADHEITDLDGTRESPDELEISEEDDGPEDAGPDAG